MAQALDTMTFVTDYLDEKTALKLLYAGMLVDQELILGKKINVKPLKKSPL